MRLSLFLPTGTSSEFPGSEDPVAAFGTILDVARTAEECGFHALWAPDHFVPFGGGPDHVFEVWTTLAALARETSRIRLGQMVTANGYRNPALQAKMASTLDVLAGGRFTFGVGAGWFEQEYAAFGYDFPPAPERLRQLRESLQVVHAMWSGSSATFEGRHYRVQSLTTRPTGVQTPHVPIMVAGGGEKVTLRLVAEFADYCNVQEPPDEVARKYGVLARHCADVGRDFSEITKTATGYCILADSDAEAQALLPPWASMVFPGNLAEYGLIGTVETIRERLAVWERAGVDELIVGFQQVTDLDVIRRFAAAFIE